MGIIESLESYTLPELIKKVFPPFRVISWGIIIAGLCAYAATATVHFIRGDSLWEYSLSYVISILTVSCGFILYFYWLANNFPGSHIENWPISILKKKNLLYTIIMVAGILFSIIPFINDVFNDHDIEKAQEAIVTLLFFISLFMTYWLVYSSLIIGRKNAEMMNDRILLKSKKIEPANDYGRALTNYISTNVSFIIQASVILTVFRILIFVVSRAATNPGLSFVMHICAMFMITYSSNRINFNELKLSGKVITPWGKVAMGGLNVAEMVSSVRMPTKEEIKEAVNEYLAEMNNISKDSVMEKVLSFTKYLK